MAIRTETKVNTLQIQVITISADEYRQVERKKWTIYAVGACVMFGSLTIDYLTKNGDSGLGTYLILLFGICFGMLLIYGSMAYKTYAHRQIASKKGWDGKSQFRVEADDEQSFMHE